MPTLNKIKLNGVTYDIGGSGGSNALIVTENASTHKVNYSPAEIRSALNNGRPVFFYKQDELIPIVKADNYKAWALYAYCFSSDDPDDDYAYVYNYEIDDEKEVTSSQVILTSKNYVDAHDYNITYGTSNPSGGEDGDIYFKYEA